MQGSLSQLRSWELDKQEDDIRGWSLRDVQGRSLGRVAELVVDTEQKHVTSVILGDGRRLPAHDISVGDHELVMLAPDSVTGPPPGGRDETDGGQRAPDPTRATGAENEPSAARAPTRPGDGPIAQEVALDDVIVSLIEEDVEFGKRRYEKGVTRAHTRIVERPFEHALRLRDEHVRVERAKVDTPLSADEANARLVDQRVEVLAVTERPVTEKHARVVEEVVLKKKAEERSERLTDTVRRTQVEITELPSTVQELTIGAKS